MVRYTFLVDTHLCLTGWGETLGRLRGGTVDTIAGAPYFRVLPAIFINGADAVQRAIEEGREVRCSNYHLSCFFGEVEADIVINPLIGEDGGTTGAEVCIDVDHTCSVSRRFEQIQPLVSIAKMSASLAHGVRNPLNAIKGAVTFLGDRYKTDPMLVEFTGIIQEEIEKLNTFITRFLSSSCPTFETSLVDLNEIIRKMCTITEYQVVSKGIYLHHSLGRIPLVAGDSFQLEHALLNLVNNAVEAMSDGGEINCETSVENRGDAAVVTVKISDDGPGFVHDPSALDYPCRERTSSGRGFGLFLSREIIQSHGGKFEISSERGVGTSVVITLPAVDDDNGR